MVVLEWRLSLVSLVVVPPAVWLTRRVALVRRDLTGQRQRLMADLHSQADEALSVNGAVLTTTLGARSRRTQAFDEASSRLVDLDLRSQLAGRWRMATMQVVFAAMPAALYLAAGFPQTMGTISIGTIVAFTALQAQVFRPIMGLLNTGAQWIASMALLSRIFGYQDLPIEVPEPENPVPVVKSEMRGDLRIEGVSYRYPDGDCDVLSDIDIHVPPGGSLAIVGETGSGKSSLSLLLVRLADPTAGRITLDGIDLRDMDSETLASLVGIVTQETYLSHASIRDNLLLAKPDATDDELWEVLRVAQIAETIESLDQGLDTIVGARGHRFSGGERQRLAIARTLLVDPVVLVLDEATSALDNETERELQSALDALSVGRTTVAIAHRLSTIERSDEIVLLDGGRIAERGTHLELLVSNGMYAHLALSIEPEEVLEETPPRRALYATSDKAF
jgi:ATP-binding cassette subfamily B protein